MIQNTANKDTKQLIVLYFLFYCYNELMAKIDEIKEILNTLRVTLSIIVGVLVVLIGNAVGRYDNSRIDEIFWLTIASCFILIIFLLLVVQKLSAKTKEIKDL